MSSKSFTRQLIPIEVKLGFLYVSAKFAKELPDTDKLSVKINSKKHLLKYNSEHRRIYGLTKFYKEEGLQGGDEVVLAKSKENLFVLHTKKKPKDSPKEKDKLAKKRVDLSGLSSQAKGDIVEDRIKELLVLHGQGLLSVYKPVTDTEGIDLIVVRNGEFHPIFIQVKGRFSLNSNRFIIDVGKKTFTPHRNFFVVGAFFDSADLEIGDTILLVPSTELEENGVTVGKTGKRPANRVVASLKDGYDGKWTKYCIPKEELANKLFEKFEEMARYLK